MERITRKKELLQQVDRLQGTFTFLEDALIIVRTKMSEHPGLTHEDEIKLLGLVTFLEKFNEVSDEVKEGILDFIKTYKFTT